MPSGLPTWQMMIGTHECEQTKCECVVARENGVGGAEQAESVACENIIEIGMTKGRVRAASWSEHQYVCGVDRCCSGGDMGSHVSKHVR